MHAVGIDPKARETLLAALCQSLGGGNCKNLGSMNYNVMHQNDSPETH